MHRLVNYEPIHTFGTHMRSHGSTLVTRFSCIFTYVIDMWKCWEYTIEVYLEEPIGYMRITYTQIINTRGPINKHLRQLNLLNMPKDVGNVTPIYNWPQCERTFKRCLTSMGVSNPRVFKVHLVLFWVSLRSLTHNHRQHSSKLLKVANKCIFECKNFGQDWICPIHERLPKS